MTLLVGAAACAQQPGSDPTATAVSETTLPGESRTEFLEGTIPAVLEADGRFETLLGLLRECSPTQLQRLNRVDPDHTVFAPTDEAFTLLPSDGCQSVLDDDESATRFFHQHILSRVFTEADLVSDVQTSDAFVSVLAGDGFLKFSIDAGRLRVVPCHLSADDCLPPDGVDSAAVIEADVKASNGLIHVVDRVLIPPST